MMNLGEKVERNITKATFHGEDTYYVHFSFRKINEVKSFPNLEDARAYRDAVNAEKLRVKTNEVVALVRKSELKDLCKEVVYPYNAYETINLMDYDVPPELAEEDVFENILKERCTEREDNAIRMFFKYKMSFKSVGEHLGCSLERARQIVYKGMKRVKYYIYHYQEMVEEQERKRIAKEESDKLDARRVELIQACRETGIISEDVTIYFGKPTFGLDESKLSDEEKTLKLPIEDLDLSVRSYNCLRRAGLTTIGSLVDKTESQMMRVKNLGKKSLKEIRYKLLDYGLFFAEE